MRLQVIYALAEMKQCQMMPEIRTGLTDENADVRKCVANAVVKCKDVASVDLLIRMLGLDRSVAVTTLGNLGDAKAVEPLIAVLRQKGTKDRQFVARALGQLHDPRAVDALIAVLQEPREEYDYLKEEAAGALGEIKDSRAVPLLRQIVASAPPVATDRVADAASEALKKLGADVPKRESKP